MLSRHLDSAEGTVVHFRPGAIDAHSACVVHDELAALVRDLGGHRLHLDLGCVQRLTAAGLGVLVAVHNELKVLGGQLTLTEVRPRLYEVLQVTRLTELFVVVSAAGDALGADAYVQKPVEFDHLLATVRHYC